MDFKVTKSVSFEEERNQIFTELQEAIYFMQGFQGASSLPSNKNLVIS